MLEEALTYLASNMPAFRRSLETLSRIPSISAAGYPEAEVTRSAEAVVKEMLAAGLTHAEVIKLDGVHAYAYGEWLGAGPKAKTVLLYGHHDVQPEGRPEKWISPPFEPTERNGRLYGRGTVDDKAGVMVHVAAIAAFLKGAGGCPVNLKFLVEGEEEIGSDNLPRFLEKFKAKVQADVVVLTDTSNFDTGIPALTYQLRGIVAADITVSALDHPVHSGMWGGPVADPAMALAKIIARLTHDDGSIAIPGLYDDVAVPSDKVRANMRSLAYDEKLFREQAGVLDGVRLVGESGYSTYEKVWIRPALSVNAIEASSMAKVSNQIVDGARARIGIRIVPKQDPERISRLLVDALRRDPPFGCRVEVEAARGTPWWQTNPEGPAFEAALRAMEKGYGRKAALVGCGGSIGFVQPFTDVLGGVPALLIGLEDPICNAHSENESLHLEDWKKAMVSAVHLYAELAKV
ncbi:MAG: M20/M25/M40 family metallo-hydrolase [Deltaproteobacteria bacterium]|nr:M20/M25/M40 family metallo-hydrolase [Deltaproteobacteria bacterium]